MIMRLVSKELEGMLADLRSGRVPRLVRFLTVGFGGLAVDMIVFRLFSVSFGLPPLVARLGSLAVATLFTWSLNRAFTFGASGRRRREEMLRYGLVTALAQGTSYAIFAVLVIGPLAAWPLLALMIGAAIATIVSYGGHAVFSFAPASAAESDSTAQRAG